MNDLNWSKGYSIPYNITLGNKTQAAEGEGLPSKVAVAQRLAGHQSAYGKRWATPFASLVFLSSFLHLLNCLHLELWVFLFLLFLLSPQPVGREHEWVAVEVLGCWPRSTHYMVTSRSFSALFSAKRIITSTFSALITPSLLYLKGQYMEEKNHKNTEKK